MHASPEQQGISPRAVGKTASRPGATDVAAAAGFACLLATMLIYSAAAMPFQRFSALPDIVACLMYALRTGAVAGSVAAVLVMLGQGRLLRLIPVRAVCAATFVAGNALFCALALGLLDAQPPAETHAFKMAVGICIGIGCVGQTLAWGRVLARYNLRLATGVVAASAVTAALLGWAQLQVPEGAAVALFMMATLACVALAGWLNRAAQVAGQDEADKKAADEKRPADRTPAEKGAGATWARVRAFLDIALIPAVGLALFAMLMAVRGELFFDDYSTYLVTQVTVAALLLVCMLLPVRMPLMHAVYRGLIPLLACIVLVVGYVNEALFGGSPVEITLVIVLYTVAALLTLSTLAGMAHAGEFPVDLISSLTVALFCLVSAGTQVLCSSWAADTDAIRGLIVVSSGLYAAGMIVATIWRALHSEYTGLAGEGVGRFDTRLGTGLETGHGVRIDGLNATPGAVAADTAASPAGTAFEPSGLNIASLTLDARCDSLARTYGLTPREREILGYLACGHTSSYIGDELVISANTVRTHVHNIYRKLGVASREDVLRLMRS